MNKSIFILYLGCGWFLFGILGHVAKKIFEITEISFFCTKKLKFQALNKKIKKSEISVKLFEISFFRYIFVHHRPVCDS